MDENLIIHGAESPADLAPLRTFVAAQGHTALHALDSHLARPRYRPAFTRIAERTGAIAGYALIGHERLRLGAATLDAGRIVALDILPKEHDGEHFVALLGDCLRVLVEEGLPLTILVGPADLYAPFGFAPYRFDADVYLSGGARAAELARLLRPAAQGDLDDLAALFEASYHTLPLTEVRAAPDWRRWLFDQHTVLALEDTRGRVIAYAAIAHGPPEDALTVAEAAAADAGAARQLCRALLARTRDQQPLCLALAPWQSVAQAALQLGGAARIGATPARAAETALAGVVDLPVLLETLVPEFDRRLAISRYAGWSGNLRIEIETERITLACENGRVTVIDGSRPADLRLRQVALTGLAQLCLGYRTAADLRATNDLACDDSALGLLDALFPAVMAAGRGIL
jgi:hypothetical protein